MLPTRLSLLLLVSVCSALFGRDSYNDLLANAQPLQLEPNHKCQKNKTDFTAVTPKQLEAYLKETSACTRNNVFNPVYLSFTFADLNNMFGNGNDEKCAMLGGFVHLLDQKELLKAEQISARCFHTACGGRITLKNGSYIFHALQKDLRQAKFVTLNAKPSKTVESDQPKPPHPLSWSPQTRFKNILETVESTMTVEAELSIPLETSGSMPVRTWSFETLILVDILKNLFSLQKPVFLYDGSLDVMLMASLTKNNAKLSDFNAIGKIVSKLGKGSIKIFDLKHVYADGLGLKTLSLDNDLQTLEETSRSNREIPNATQTSEKIMNLLFRICQQYSNLKGYSATSILNSFLLDAPPASLHKNKIHLPTSPTRYINLSGSQPEPAGLFQIQFIGDDKAETMRSLEENLQIITKHEDITVAKGMQSLLVYTPYEEGKTFLKSLLETSEYTGKVKALLYYPPQPLLKNYQRLPEGKGFRRPSPEVPPKKAAVKPKSFWDRLMA